MTTELENAMASLRSALPDDETDHGHVVIESDAIRSVLAALSTPPADDVRELVDHLNGLMDSLDDSVSHEQVYEQLRVAWEMARTLRPRGTVTDAAALAKAWDEGFTLATRNSPNQPHPLAQSNPYRGEARS